MRAHVAKLLCLAALMACVPVLGAAAGTAKNPITVKSALAAGVLKQLNLVRTQHHLVALTTNKQLTAAALQHSKEMLTKGYFGHSSFDGTSWQKRIKSYYKGAVGENLLWSAPDVAPARALTLWLGTPEHKAAILNPHWREIGIGAVHSSSAPGKFNGLPVTAITTDFGTRK